MSYPQLPYEYVQEQNAYASKMLCKPLKRMSQRQYDLIAKLLSIFDLDTYSWKDPNHIVNQFLDSYGNVKLVDFCSEMPEMCDLASFTVKEMGALTKMSLKDLQEAACSFELQTTCQQGDKNCGNLQEVADYFCNKTCASRDFKGFHKNYSKSPYYGRYEGWYDSLCKTCKYRGKLGGMIGGSPMQPGLSIPQSGRSPVPPSSPRREIGRASCRERV